MKRSRKADFPDLSQAPLDDGLPLPAPGEQGHGRKNGPPLGLDAIRMSHRRFVEGGALPTFWRDRPGFTIVDTGFDAGSCFLATWSAWQNDPHARARLHYVAFDPDATTQHTLQARWRNFLASSPHSTAPTHVGHKPDTPDAAGSDAVSDTAGSDVMSEETRLHIGHIHHLRELIAIWPSVIVEGIRTLELDGGRVVLTLAIGDVAALARNMRLRGDAFFLRAGSGYGARPIESGSRESLDGGLSQICKALARMAAVGAPIVAAALSPQDDARSDPVDQRTNAAFALKDNRVVSAATSTAASTAAYISAAMAAAGFEVSHQVVPITSNGPARPIHSADLAHSADSEGIADPAGSEGPARHDAPSAPDSLLGHFAPRWRVRRHPPPAAQAKMTNALSTEADDAVNKTALVIGAGLAGCHVVERLAAKGWKVRLIDSADQPANGASGNPAGVFHPMITADEGLAARLSRSGFLHALSRWQALERAGFPLRWGQAGLLQLGLHHEDGWRPTQHVALMPQPPGLPKSIVEDVDARRVGDLIGIADAAYPPASWHFKQGGWIDPVSLCHALLAASEDKLTRHFGHWVDRLEHRDGMWHALDTQGEEIAAARIVIIANAFDAQRLAQLHHVNMDNIRGQLTFLPPGVVPDLLRPVTGNGYLTPSPDGAITGASYGVGDTRTEVDVKDHADNLERLASLLGRDFAKHTLPFGIDASTLRGRVAFRCTSRDRLPMIGMLGDERLTAQRAGSLTGAHALDLPRCEGLYAAFGYGSRGLIWSALAAELLLSQIEHTPPPLETDLIDAIDPARFLLRDVRRGKVR